jgi:hypothetical protein
VAEAEITQTAQPGARGRYGALSLWAAFGAFAVSMAAIAVLSNSPRRGTTPAWEFANVVAILVLFALAPLGNLAGTVFGIIGLSRRSERRGLAVAGLAINGTAILMALGFFAIMLRGLGTFH